MADVRADLNDTGENINGAIEDNSYVYRGPKNKTGIYKNSLILKDLTGYVEGEDNTGAVNETIDAGTQTIVAEEPKI